MTNTPDDWGLRPGNNKQPFKVVTPSPTIEESLEVTRQLIAATPPPPKDAFRENVAHALHDCRYLDVKGIAKDVMGEPPKTIETVADLADRMAEWAAANKTKASP